MKAFGLKAKNPGQEEAIKVLLDPEIDLVVLQGIAGSGKTLLALAAGLEQILETHMYSEIIFTRSIVGVGKDIGLLPGTEEEKMAPWAGGLMDNLEYLLGGDRAAQKFASAKIKIKALQFLRGRSFMKRYIIIDEVQNMSFSELKVILTRAGEDTKVVCLGDINQIDTRGLTKETNALSVLMNNSQTKFVRFVTLPDGERSRLASWAAVL